MTRILIVEDDQALTRMLQRVLAAHGYEAVTVADGRSGATMANDPLVGLVILDIGLPRMDGSQVLFHIRQERPRLPVLMLTGRDETKDKVEALEAGADDYLTKPFAVDELVARIRSLTRRAQQQQAPMLEVGDLSLDLLHRRVRRDSHEAELSTRECELLAYFMAHPDKVLSRQQLLSAVWALDFDPQSNIVDVYVRYLRRKIDRHGSPSLIQAIRNAGYRFRPAPVGSRPDQQ
ncbi:MAG TPA: response regulator transcription factor [Nocardioidaceae bacterium]|nr:response regulator transcription factor [Nocardioidaceae bacterium]